MTREGEIWVNGIRLQNTRFDYPVAINSQVEYWIDYFVGRGRKHFERYLERSELFIPYIVPILREQGVPEDLVYLSMIESGFNNHARSHARAVGPWQFMPFTGKRYGLMVNWWVDERRDTRKSTLAAIQYLKDLHSIFNSWELASAAYNAGEAKVARAIRRYGTYDFWAIARQKFLRPETRNYVPKIIAAAIVSKNRTQFGFKPSTIQPGKDEAVSGDGEVVKLEKADASKRTQEEVESLKSVIDTGEPLEGSEPTSIDRDALAQILQKPEYNDYENAPSPTDWPAAPEPTAAEIAEREAESDEPQAIEPSPRGGGQLATALAMPLAAAIPTPKVGRDGEIRGEILAEFELQGPADLLKIARAAGLSYQTVKALNPELLRWCTPPAVSTYRIKLPASAKDAFLAAYNHEAFPRRVQFFSHKVRKGETLGRIARHYGIRVDPVVELNRISAQASLRAGSYVLLPIPRDRTRSLASLEVHDPPEKRMRRARYRGKTRRRVMHRVSYPERKRAAARRGGSTRRSPTS